MGTATLIGLLRTVHANQTQIIIPQLSAIAQGIAALNVDMTELGTHLDNEIAILNGKLDQIIAQVTLPETGNLNLSSAIVTHKE